MDSIIQFFTIISSIIAVLISIWINEYLSRKRIINQRKDEVLKLLIQNRYNPQSTEFLRAMNAIPIVFKDHLNIRNKQDNLYELIEAENKKGVSTQKRNDLLYELIMTISHELGYSNKITSDDIRRVFIN